MSILYDGVVLENALLKGFPAFDLDRIEVLRGPQGTLFGRNTPAGIVKFESARPTQTLDGYGRLSYGQFNTSNFEGAVSGPLVPSVLVGARLSLLAQWRDDWVDNEHTGEDNALGGHRDLAGRFQLLWTPMPELEAWLKFHARDLDGTARLFRANILSKGETGLVQDFTRDRIAHDGRNEQTLEDTRINCGSPLRYWKLPTNFAHRIGTVDQLLARGHRRRIRCRVQSTERSRRDSLSL